MNTRQFFWSLLIAVVAAIIAPPIAEAVSTRLKTLRTRQKAVQENALTTLDQGR